MAPALIWPARPRCRIWRMPNPSPSGGSFVQAKARPVSCRGDLPCVGHSVHLAILQTRTETSDVIRASGLAGHELRPINTRTGHQLHLIHRSQRGDPRSRSRTRVIRGPSAALPRPFPAFLTMKSNPKPSWARFTPRNLLCHYAGPGYDDRWDNWPAGDLEHKQMVSAGPGSSRISSA